MRVTFLRRNLSLDIFIIFIKNLVVAFLSFLQLAMLIRAVLSWFIMDGGKFVDFLYAVTEPFIYPIRRLLEKMNWLQGTPIDFSFMIAFFIISFLSIILV